MDPETITRCTYDEIAIPYSLKTLQSRVRLGILPALTELADLTLPGQRVLVLGAGDGRDGFFLKTRGLVPTYLDYSHAMNKLVIRQDRHAAAVSADIRMIPFANESFGAIWASMCLYHLRGSSLRIGLAEAFRVLRPGGIFYFNLLSGKSEGMISRPSSYPEGGPRFYARYLSHEIASLVEAFQTIRIQSFTANWETI